MPAAQMFGGNSNSYSPSIGELHVHNEGGRPMNPQDIARAIAQVWDQNPGLRPKY
jgi:hypothetical protein